jgi:2-C-methyl-D-erythritol 2,4-cyclodiphosphate synthase
MKEMRIGHGYDVHRLTEERKLIIGGVDIPHEKGLLGHSDADVLIHSIMDAIIGALGKGDIGKHFPDTCEEFKGISSMNLLARVKKLLDDFGGRIINVDSTLVLQKPKVSPYIDRMRSNIAFALNTDVGRINVKATTEEKLGFTGSCEGAAAHAVVLIEIDA